MLSEFGLDCVSERVYRTALERGSWRRAELLTAAQVDTADAERCLDELVRMRLLRPSVATSEELAAVSPELALGRIVSDREREIADSQALVNKLRQSVEEFSGLYREQSERRRTRELEVLSDREEATRRVSELAPREEMLAFTTTPPSAAAFEAALQPDIALLRNGVRMRNVGLASSRSIPHVLRYVREVSTHGARFRVMPSLPVRLILVDRAVGVVALDPLDPGGGAVVVRVPGMLAAISSLFEMTWSAAEDFLVDDANNDPGHPGDHVVPTRTELELLKLLAAGLKDDAVARHLGVSVRTVRRSIADLTGRLGATSRFDLAAVAGRRGWV